MARAPALRRLDLGYNALGNSGAAAIAGALWVAATSAGTTSSRHNKNGNENDNNNNNNIRGSCGCGLQDLDLQRNSIGDAGASELASALRKNTSLRRLDLRSNAIGAAGMAELGLTGAGRVESNFMVTSWASSIPRVASSPALSAAASSIDLTALGGDGGGGGADEDRGSEGGGKPGAAAPGAGVACPGTSSAGEACC